ncbi:hypothetical protein [Sorangium sp. So ce131]|uniref:hypothetical protein n=1 Tax=Sorangium sp. So ce131 TaxID=3133282 RepID=UPI003F5E521F
MSHGAGEQTVLWIDLGGTFEGARGVTAVSGRLSLEQLSSLRELFRDERIVVYEGDALPTDGSVDLQGTAERPIFRVVVREASGAIQPGSEKLEAYFAEGAQHVETEEMLSEVKKIIAQATQAP